MRDFQELKRELLQDEEVRKEYEDLDPEYQLIKTMIEARKKLNITQQELSKRTGIDRTDISRIETGNANPSLRTMKRLANGLNMNLEIKFVPKN